MSSTVTARRGRRGAQEGPRASLRQLLPFVFEHRRVLAIVVALSVVGAGASLAQPLIVGQVITRVQADDPLGWLVWALVALVVVASLISGYQHYLLQRTGTAVVYSSRRKLIARILHLPIGEFDARRTGDLVSRVGTDTTLLYAVLTQGFVDAIGNSLVFLGALFAILRPLFHEDAVFPASEPHTVVVPAHTERALFTNGTSGLTCSAVDGTGAVLPLRLVTGDFTVNEWQAVFRFDSGDGEVTLDCGLTGGSADVRVGELPSTGTFVVGLLVGILGPIVLGLVGGIILVVTFVRYLTRQPRPPASQPPIGTIEY